MTVLLKLKGLTKKFGGLIAVHEVSLDLYPDEILGLIGPNGAGKTTIFNMISGSLGPTAGRIDFENREITQLKPHEAACLGIARTFQLVKPFAKMSVLDNVMVGAFLRTRRTGIAREKANGTWYISASLLRSIWRRILVGILGKDVFLQEPCQKNFGASIDCSTIRKSAAAYIGKYMSKGSTTVEAMQEAGFEHYPSQWWTACKTVKAMFANSVIRLDSNTCASFFYQLEHYLVEKMIVWSKYLYRPIGEKERCVGLIGRLSDWAYQLLKEPSFDSS